MSAAVPDSLSLSPSVTRGLLPVAAYVRMSTDHQQYSTANQLERIQDYAARRGMQISRVFADEGKSGLSVRGRESLRRLIAEVEQGHAGFRAILAYDVSRWGRFQDADESGYYEYLCKRAGIQVHYCAEQFENDGSPASNIIKSVKRSMAGEYSRELSSKVFQGACRLIQLGFKQGGQAGYGLRRMVLDPAGHPKGVLERGEQKFLATDRVVLVPGPESEQAIVREIFEHYVHHNRTVRQIVENLNRRQITNGLGRHWREPRIHDVLTNEKYIGNLVYHKRSCKLQGRFVVNPPEMWIRSNGAFQAIVDPVIFARAQEILRERGTQYTEEELLAAMRGCWSRRGRISAPLIDREPGMPASSTYIYRFGSLLTAYRRIGFDPCRDLVFLTANRRVQTRRREFVQTLLAAFADRGVQVEHDPAGHVVRVAGEWTVAVVVARCHRTKFRTLRWSVRPDLSADLTLAVRLGENNETIQDYFMFPALDRPGAVTLRPRNHRLIDSYRFDNLDPLFALASRVSVEDAA